MEIERPKELLEMEIDENKELSELEILKTKLEATNAILNELNHGKHVKINSIMKSRYDWKKFLKDENIKDKMEYQRKIRSRQ